MLKHFLNGAFKCLQKNTTIESYTAVKQQFFLFQEAAIFTRLSVDFQHCSWMQWLNSSWRDLRYCSMEWESKPCCFAERHSPDKFFKSWVCHPDTPPVGCWIITTDPSMLVKPFICSFNQFNFINLNNIESDVSIVYDTGCVFKSQNCSFFQKIKTLHAEHHCWL